jgi:hypothetical protein
MTSTLKIMNICCLLFIEGSLERIRFGLFRDSGFQVMYRLGEQSTCIDDRWMIKDGY